MTIRYLTEAERSYIVTALWREAAAFSKLADSNETLRAQFIKQRSECQRLADDIQDAEDIELG